MRKRRKSCGVAARANCHGVRCFSPAAARRHLLPQLNVGGFILIIDAKGERAARWYADSAAFL
jgi:hypothetical protein